MFAVCYLCICNLSNCCCNDLCYCFGVSSLVRLSSYNNDYETEPCDPLLAQAIEQKGKRPLGRRNKTENRSVNVVHSQGGHHFSC